jgi:heptosyltransferase-2
MDSLSANIPSERILVRGVNWLGDAVMTTPALQRLREAHPRAHVALLTHPKLAGLWTHHPDVDQVLTWSAGEGVRAVARRLQGLDFTVALVLPNSPRSAIEMWLAGIPRRIGHARRWRNFFLTQRVPPPPPAMEMRKRSVAEIRQLIASPSSTPAPALATTAHHLHQYLNLVAALGARREPVAPRLVVTPAEVEAVRARFGVLMNGENQPPRLLGVNPGAEYGPAKRWPRDRFIAAAVAVRKATGCHIWVFGGARDVELAGGIAAEISAATAGGEGPVRSIAGQTSLRELCAALKACDVVLTNDTGPMHVAAAVGTRVVVPFGSTSPELTGPGLPGTSEPGLIRVPVPCAPCFRRECPIDFRCMTGIGVERIVAALLKAIG